MEKVLVIMMGIQGSGKSTFYHQFLAKDFVRVNLDTLKTRNQEKLLIEDLAWIKNAYAQTIKYIKNNKQIQYTIPFGLVSSRLITVNLPNLYPSKWSLLCSFAS
jgi:predicted ABC-type ATPase